MLISPETVSIGVRIGFPPEFPVPGSNPEKPRKITIFPGWKTMRKNPEITRKFPGSGFQPRTWKNFRVPTWNPEKFPGSNPELGTIRKFFRIPTRNPEHGNFSGFQPERCHNHILCETDFGSSPPPPM